jgi:type I restriction enzyme S subunit
MSGDMPDGWRNARLGNVAVLGGGTTPSRVETAYWEDAMIPWATPSDITSLASGIHRIADTETKVSEKALAECSLTLNPPGTVLMTSRATIGFAAINRVPMATNQGFITFRAGEYLDPDFLLYWLTAQRDNLVAAAGGSTFKELSRGTAKLLPILLPPLDEQRRVAEVLRSVDEVLQETDAALGLLKSVKHGTLSDILVHDRTPEDWTLTPVGQLGAKSRHAIVDGPFGSNLKSEHYRSAGIPVFQSGFVTSSQFKPTKYVFVDNDLFQKQIRSRAVGGDILMAKIGAQAGRCAIIPNDHPEGIIAGNCLKITVDPHQCSAEFLHTVLTFMYGVTGLREIITETAQPAISLARLKSLLVPLPPLGTQAVIMDGIHALDLAIEIEVRKRANLHELKAALMSDLLVGRVRVPA